MQRAATVGVARLHPTPGAALQAATNGRVLMRKGRAEEVEWCARESQYTVIGTMDAAVIRPPLAMRRKWQHLVAELSERLPDVSRQPVRKQVGGALLASVLLHLLIFGSIMVIGAVLPEQRPDVDFARLPASGAGARSGGADQTASASTGATTFSLAAQERPYIDSAGLTKSERPPRMRCSRRTRI
jgi:hypothetical protein